MPTADLSPYTQPQGTTSDGNKFGNLLTYLQGLLNGLDNNNIAAAAGIKGSQLASGLTGSPGTLLAYAELTSTVTALGGTHTESSPIDVVSAGAFAFDGSTAVWVEFYAPNLATSGAMTGGISVWDNNTDQGRLWDTNSQSIQVGGGTFRRKYTPPSGSRTIKIRAWSATGGLNFAIQPGAGGAGVRLPAYIALIKA